MQLEESNHQPLSIKIIKYIVYFVFLIYIIVLLKIILFKDSSLSDILTLNINNYRSYNLIPGKTVYDYVTIGGMNGLRIIANTLGNMGIFMPLGFLLPFTFKKIKCFRNVLLIALPLSVLFETMQYLFSLGSADIDDVFLNVIGATLGYAVFTLFKRLFKDRKSFYLATLILIIVSSAIAFTIVWEEFGDLFGINKHVTEYVGQENIPKGDADLYGTYINSENNSINMYSGLVFADSPEQDFVKKVDVKIDSQTTVFYQNIKEEKKKSTISYEPYDIKDINKIKEYSGIQVWLTDNDTNIADVILLSDPMGNSSGEISISGDETDTDIELSGQVVKLDKDGATIHLILESDDGNGGLYSVQTEEPMEVLFDEDVKYSYILQTLSEDILEDRKGKKSDVKIGVDLDMKGYISGKQFVAHTVHITEFQ